MNLKMFSTVSQSLAGSNEDGLSEDSVWTSIHMARLNSEEESRRPDLMREVSAVIFDTDSGKLSRISSRSSALKDMRFQGGLGEIWIGGDRRPGWPELKNSILQIDDHLACAPWLFSMVPDRGLRSKGLMPLHVAAMPSRFIFPLEVRGISSNRYQREGI